MKYIALIILCVSFINLGNMGYALANMPDPQDGRKVWEKMKCAICHGKWGKPTIPNAPDFSRGVSMEKSNRELLEVIINGRKLMPGWNGRISTKQMLNVIAYIRTFQTR